MKTNLLKTITKTLTVAIIVLFGSTASAQNISTVTIPTTTIQSCTGITIQVLAVQNCINYIYVGTSQSIVGNTLFLNLDWQTPSPICFGALSQVQEDFVFPTVPAGVNTVEVRGFLDGIQASMMSGSFTAISCCPSQASFTSNIISKCSAEPDTFLFTNTSTGATSQEWYLDNVLTSTAVNFAPTITTVGVHFIKLRVTDGTCADSSFQQVDIFQTPNVNLGADIVACVNTFETLDAGPGYANYAWSSTAANTQTINIVSTDSYNVVVTSNDGCTGTDTLEASFNPLPIVDLGNDTAVCINNTILLDAGAYESFSWNTTDTTQTVVASPAGGVFGIFEVEVTDSNGCQNTDNIMLSGLVPPNIDFGDDSISICTGDTVILVAGTHTTYNWSNGASNSSIYAFDNQLYYVTVTNADNCAASDSIYVDLLDNPVVSLGNDTTICFGDNVTFDAGTFASYSWPDNSTNQTFDLDSNMYTLGDNTVAVAVVDNNGCTGSDMLTLEVIDCDTAVGIQSLSFSQEVLVYPNPTKDFVVIEMESALKILDVSIVDLSGKTILSSNYEDVNFVKFNTESLGNGLYFLVLKSGKRMEFRKLSKK